jgi:hypothetical protein
MKKQNVFIFMKLMISIADLEAKWKSSNEMWNAKQEKKKIKKRNKNDEYDDVQFIVNTMNDSNLRLQMNEQADFMTCNLRNENHFEDDHFKHDEDDYFN